MSGGMATRRDTLCAQLKVLDRLMDHYERFQPHVKRVAVTFNDKDLSRFAAKENGVWFYREFELYRLNPARPRA